ncbi:MAG TPA: LPS export ABC transporter periplasmic protein LptC [Pyrinomonadaceae bacterium]|nr:LPS export ABC transporter periplasmic protein LptC [Pyrinomonadaceae bacterium]
MPQYFRIAAIAALVLTILAAVIGFYRERNKTPFHLKSEHTQLSQDVIAEVNGYERLETDGDIPKYYIKADKATTFSDNHQEMENVYLQVYDQTGTKSDKMSAEKGLYVPEDNKNFTAYLAGNVHIETRDALIVNTPRITYTKATETAEADQNVQFERNNVRGTSSGALVKVADKRIELLRDVQIETFASPELQTSNVREAKINAGYAALDQANERLDMQHGVTVDLITNGTNGASRIIDVQSDHASANFVKAGGEQPRLTKLELFDNVKIASREGDGKPTNIDAGYALYEKDADRFSLKNGAHIVTIQDDHPTDIKAAEAVYEQTAGAIDLTGNAEINQGNNLVRGDRLAAQLFVNKKLKNATARGNAYLKQTTDERTVDIASPELNATFGENQQLLFANAVGSSNAGLTPAQPGEYSKVMLSAANAIHVRFRGEGLLEQMDTQGRTTIKLDVPDSGPDASNKTLTADSVRTVFDQNGKDLQKAEAVGDAELAILPLHASADSYQTVVNAPRFDCDFFPNGNNVRYCAGATKTKTVRTPTQTSDGHNIQTLLADKLQAYFQQQSRDIDRLEAVGNAKFNEADRNAISSSISFSPGEKIVRMRGGEPTVWDSHARAKAREIDWNTQDQKSFLRSGVSTTYYSQKQSGGATPFSDAGKPVFVTAESAEFDYRAQTGAYLGNARGWQEKNYVRADRFLIDQNKGRFFADGNVQSLLYDVKRKENGTDSTVPVYAAAKKMLYDRDKRILRYENGVDIRQGVDRIVADIASVYLDEKNEVSQTIAENNVVITQPDRKAVGDYAQYNAANETVLLRGNPARIDDSENGSSQGGEVMVYLRENRVVGEGKTKQNTAGRIRSVYKVKNN